MKPGFRLALAALMIIGSACYGLLVAQDPGLASAVASGYVAAVLTLFVLVTFWKKGI